MQITPSSGLSPNEIERLIIEAETSVEKDKEERELINRRNQLETLIRNARKAMAEVGKAFPLEFQQEINAKLGEADEVLKSGSGSEITQAVSAVEATSSKITEAMLTAV
jgi:molecular chaperone DnaK